MSRSIFIAAALSFAALSAGAANAQERQAAQVHVSARHVDFNNARETRGFYAKLNAAAQQVCTSEVSDPMTTMADAACEREAVSDAVRQIDAPQLSALHGHSDHAPAYAERSVSTRRN
ncbi:UrcA family protein [Asticcacaulis sp.]|uniref:UrcA family protein n=1 Tax=Asticcacaulis sp. TaxID=1872648 RepID=UPI003F7C55B1